MCAIRGNGLIFLATFVSGGVRIVDLLVNADRPAKRVSDAFPWPCRPARLFPRRRTMPPSLCAQMSPIAEIITQTVRLRQYPCPISRRLFLRDGYSIGLFAPLLYCRACQKSRVFAISKISLHKQTYSNFQCDGSRLRPPALYYRVPEQAIYAYVVLSA